MSKLETKTQKFMRIVMMRSWSIPFQVKNVIQYKRKWEQGLTSKQLLDEVKKQLRLANYKKKANRIKVGSIYDAVGKINLLHIPPFYIDCQGRLIANGKYEYRYFVPFNSEDIQNAKGKQIRQGTVKFTKAHNVEEFGIEIEKEQEKEKLLQPQSMEIKQ